MTCARNNLDLAIVLLTSQDVLLNRGSEQTGNSLNVTFIRLLRSSAQHFSPLQETCNRAQA
eukprot:1836314-Amphidinium_carterae.1